ncbi:interferon-inducible GTPase-domain-containing protein [Panaeolus papilionaceus]|nr:interferon-inducible GTPase-domain-containing protein [Panaeolus papilionaceus]
MGGFVSVALPILNVLGVIAASAARRAEREDDQHRVAEHQVVIRSRQAEQLTAAARGAEEERRQAERARRDAEETMRRVEEERRRAQAEMREEQARMREQGEEMRRRTEEETRRRMEMVRRQEEDARRREQDARRREEEAERSAEEARRRGEEAERQAEEAVRQAREAQRRSDEARREAEEARRRVEDQWMRGIPPDFRPTEEIKQRFRQRYRIQDSKINIAIVGEAGMGKSSLLNALRGLSPRDRGAAPTGFNETTAIVQGYPDLRNPNIVWYDVPGASTPTVQGWMYFAEQGLFVFSLIVVVFADRFTQTTGTLISNANKCSIPAFLVRTKADQLVRNVLDDYEDEPLSDREARELVVTETRQMVAGNLARLKLPMQRVYIVSKFAMKRLVSSGDTSAVIDEQRVLDDIRHLGLLDNSHSDVGMRHELSY